MHGLRAAGGSQLRAHRIIHERAFGARGGPRLQFEERDLLTPRWSLPDRSSRRLSRRQCPPAPSPSTAPLAERAKFALNSADFGLQPPCSSNPAARKGGKVPRNRSRVRWFQGRVGPVLCRRLRRSRRAIRVAQMPHALYTVARARWGVRFTSGITGMSPPGAPGGLGEARGVPHLGRADCW